MNQRRVCDACSVRRVRCDKGFPCTACTVASLDCTRCRPRQKSGPKGLRNKTLEKLAALTKGQPAPSRDVRATASPNPRLDSLTVDGLSPNLERSTRYGVDTLSSEPAASPVFSDGISAEDTQRHGFFHDATSDAYSSYPYKLYVDLLVDYIDIYHHRLYPVWPIVDRAALVARLEAQPPAVEAYMLASSMCVATNLQFQLAATGPDGSLVQPELIIDEIEDLRRIHDHREHPTLDSLSISFFLHVAYIHVGKRTTSILLLREAISTAHLLDLHKPSHYENLPESQVQEDLRKLWLLFITERYTNSSPAQIGSTHIYVVMAPPKTIADLT